MKRKFSSFAPQENLISILPSIVAGIFVLSATVIARLLYFPIEDQFTRNLVILFGIAGSMYLAFYYLRYTTSVNKTRFTWVNVAISAITLGAITPLIPEEINMLLYILAFISCLATSLISTRGPAYVLASVFTTIHFTLRLGSQTAPYDWVIYVVLLIAALMAIETIQQLKKIAREHINRLEGINELSKQIVSTLDTKQVFSLLNAAFQNALEADSYFIGIVDGEEIRLELCYDDGEYFHDLRLPIKGSFSGWVIDHKQELYLPDLRQNVQLDGVETVLVGQQKTSLSWIGVPMLGAHVAGIMAIASYRPNSFDRSDLELLSTIAQRATLALDNAHQHAYVEQQGRLDSLTQVYNHGYFLQTLQKQTQECLAKNQPLSLIMLDIDFFKQYNDTFGHLVGDEVLIGLCDTIRMHIKSTDAVGRWGGEEFTVCLPNTNGTQASQIAQRIRESMFSIKIKNTDHASVPIPTVSMGIAVFPAETNDPIKLIDLADRRLYMAKERGRDQIEPALVS